MCYSLVWSTKLIDWNWIINFIKLTLWILINLLENNSVILPCKVPPGMSSHLRFTLRFIREIWPREISAELQLNARKHSILFDLSLDLYFYYAMRQCKLKCPCLDLDFPWESCEYFKICITCSDKAIGTICIKLFCGKNRPAIQCTNAQLFRSMGNVPPVSSGEWEWIGRFRIRSAGGGLHPTESCGEKDTDAALILLINTEWLEAWVSVRFPKRKRQDSLGWSLVQCMKDLQISLQYMKLAEVKCAICQ